MCLELLGLFPIFCAVHLTRKRIDLSLNVFSKVMIYALELFTVTNFLCLLQVDREYHVQKALFAAGFPVPEPLLYCSDVSVIGTEFYVMQHVQVGRPMWQIFFYYP